MCSVCTQCGRCVMLCAVLFFQGAQRSVGIGYATAPPSQKFRPAAAAVDSRWSKGERVVEAVVDAAHLLGVV